jgi:hypothetical protein
MTKSGICSEGHRIELPSEYDLAIEDSQDCVTGILSCKDCEHAIEVWLKKIKEPDTKISSRLVKVDERAVIDVHHIIKMPYSLNPASEKEEPGAVLKKIKCEKCPEFVELWVKENKPIKEQSSSQGGDSGSASSTSPFGSVPGPDGIIRYPGWIRFVGLPELDPIVRIPGPDPIYRNPGPAEFSSDWGSISRRIGVGTFAETNISGSNLGFGASIVSRRGLR